MVSQLADLFLVGRVSNEGDRRGRVESERRKSHSVISNYGCASRSTGISAISPSLSPDSALHPESDQHEHRVPTGSDVRSAGDGSPTRAAPLPATDELPRRCPARARERKTAARACNTPVSCRWGWLWPAVERGGGSSAEARASLSANRVAPQALALGVSATRREAGAFRAPRRVQPAPPPRARLSGSTGRLSRAIDTQASEGQLLRPLRDSPTPGTRARCSRSFRACALSPRERVPLHLHESPTLSSRETGSKRFRSRPGLQGSGIATFPWPRGCRWLSSGWAQSFGSTLVRSGS